MTNNKYCDYLLINFWDSWNNYGALLTAFAMQQLIRSFGYTTKYLDTGERTKRTSYKKSFGDEFSKNFLTKTSIMNYKQTKEFSKQIKGIILGSDQVLRLRFINHAYSKYLLNFAAKNCKKIALSASFGISKEEFLKENAKKDIKRVKFALQDFDYLSCREISSKDIYKEVFNLASDMIMDPVFLIEKDEYNIILEKATLDCSNKIVSYVLDTNEEYDNLYNNLSKKLNNEIVHLYKKEARPSVANWLNSIKTCKFLITDSFHGVCFALIFNKPFVCIKNIRRGSARFDSLCEIFNIEQCFVSDAKEVLNYNFTDLDFKHINEKIQLEKDRCLKIIHSVLNENYSNNPNKTSTNHSDYLGYFKNLLEYLKNKTKAIFQSKKKKKNKYKNLARKAKHNMIWS